MQDMNTKQPSIKQVQGIEGKNLMKPYRVAQNKNGTAFFPQYVDAITGISVYMR